MSCLLTRLRCATSLYNGLKRHPCVNTSDSLPYTCPYCRNVPLKPLMISNIVFHNDRLRHASTFTRLRELLSTSTKKKRRSKQKYVELIQVSDKTGTEIRERLAAIKKSSPTKVLQKLGVTSASKSNISPRHHVPSSSTANVMSTQRIHGSASSTFKLDAKEHITDSMAASIVLSASQHQQNAVQENNANFSTNAARNNLTNEPFRDTFVDKFEDHLTYEAFKSGESISSVHELEEDLDILEDSCVPGLSIPQYELGLINDVFPEIRNTSSEEKAGHSATTSNNKASHKTTKKKVNKPKKKPIIADKDMEQAAKRSRLQNNLLPFLDVCVNSNAVQKAHQALMFYHQRSSHYPNSHLNNIRLYNIVLSGWAKNGEWKPLEQILALMNREGPKPNLQSYCSALECLSRAKDKHVLTVKNLLDTVNKQGLDIRRILCDCTFVGDQKIVVLKIIRSVLPQFVPFKPNKVKGYDCPLLDQLNLEVDKDRNYSPAGSLFTDEHLRASAKFQMNMEVEGFAAVKTITKKSAASEQMNNWRKKLKECEDNWRQVLTTGFEKSVDSVNSRLHVLSGPNGINLHPFLKSMETSVFVNLMMQEIANIGQLSEAFSPLLSTLQRALGVKVMERYLLQTKQNNGILDKTKLLYDEYCKYYCNAELTSKYSPREYWEILLAKHCEGPDMDCVDVLWPNHVVLGVGRFLYDLIIKNVKVDANLLRNNSKTKRLNPAFYTIYRKQDAIKIREEIKPHPVLIKLYQLSTRDELIFDSTVMPMSSPPLPWTSVRSGAFLLSTAKIIRLPEMAFSAQHRARIEDVGAQQMYPIFDSLNQLGEAPWIINKPMLDLVIEVFNNKGCAELDIPQPISECPSLPKPTTDMTKQEIAKCMQTRNAIRQQKAEMYSLWCDMLYKLSIANHYRDRVIWFPHNMDFRGRVYPCPPHFNHLGSDVSRSLLLFAKGEPLGKDGLKWLKTHLINLTGLKKRASLEERLAYCDEIMSEIKDSAEKPFTGNKWWTKSDEPWQTLACCMELVKALQHPDHEKYVCHFPVHQDGSCNGLQHYAALGCDQQGAEQVNLQPSPVPQDVYSGVAEMVERERARDAANGVKIASVLEGFITRKVVKQPVMTTVYGVTRYGARLQIIRQLKDLQGFPQEYKWQAAGYLVSKTFQCLQEMFSSTKQIQDWFTDSATLISQVCGQPVEWVTPLGLTVVQPYFKHAKQGSKHADLWKRSGVEIPNLPNTRKQKNAFPPNYIHSLDSTHMMLTALYCLRAGITFVSVHDCFWTHPSTVDTMNKICREQFVALHNQPLLETLSEHLLKVYAKPDVGDSEVNVNMQRLVRVLSLVPKKGMFELKNVLSSTYFFS